MAISASERDQAAAMLRAVLSEHGPHTSDATVGEQKWYWLLNLPRSLYCRFWSGLSCSADHKSGQRTYVRLREKAEAAKVQPIPLGISPAIVVSLAPGIERREIAAVHGHEVRRQPAMAIDPGADFRRIEPHQAPSACSSRHQRARNIVVIGRSVETQHGSLGDADVTARHDASQQRARRQAWARR